MPASVSTPSTSTHSRRTLRARSNTVTTGLLLPIEGLGRQQRVGLDVDRRYASDQPLQVIGRDAIARTLDRQHVRAQYRTGGNRLRGDHALRKTHAHRALRFDDSLFARAHGGLDRVDVTHQFFETNWLQ